MTTNTVTVTASFGALTGMGDWLFAASGTLMSDANVAIVTPVVNGSLDATGSLSAVLLASDNFSEGELQWNAFIRIQGLPHIHAVGFDVKFSLGATQNLFTVLEAGGWTPTPTA
jgi:hypothetical protein